MFFPIIIAPPKSGKLALIYAGAWLAAALIVINAVVPPLMEYKMATDPSFQLSQKTVISNADLMFSQWIGIALAIVGILVVAIYLYQHREEIKRAWRDAMSK